jgi:hypothetical protein
MVAPLLSFETILEELRHFGLVALLKVKEV